LNEDLLKAEIATNQEFVKILRNLELFYYQKLIKNYDL